MDNFLKVNKKKAEETKQKLIQMKIYTHNIKPQSDEGFVYFPISNSSLAKSFGKIVKRESKEKYFNRTKSLKDIFSEIGLSSDEAKLVSSYDLVGDIAILKITPDMIKYETQIAKALIETNPQIKTVVKKVKEHHGVYRVQSVKYLAGKRTFTTYAKEAGAVFKVRVGDMFFSPRLSFERLRIAEMIKPNSNVAVFFSGVAPFSIVIAKKQPLVNKVLSIELNPKAHKNAIENIELNKLSSKVEAVCADVREYAQKIDGFADYVIMPLPKTSDDFLDAAYKAVRKYDDGSTGIISLYKFVPTKNPYKELVKELEDFAKSKGKRLDVLFKRQVRDYSHDIEQIVIDFRFN